MGVLWGHGVLGCTVVLCPEHSRDPKVSYGVAYRVRGVMELWGVLWAVL